MKVSVENSYNVFTLKNKCHKCLYAFAHSEHVRGYHWGLLISDFWPFIFPISDFLANILLISDFWAKLLLISDFWAKMLLISDFKGTPIETLIFVSYTYI